MVYHRLLSGIKSRLSIKLFFYVVLCSLFFALLASSFQVYRDFRREIGSIDASIDFIRENYLPPLSNSVYILNEEQVNLLLKSLLQIQDIELLEIHDRSLSKESIYMMGNRQTRRDLVATFPLTYQAVTGKRFDVGDLTIVASYEGVYERLWEKTSITLLITTIQIFLAAFSILFIIYIFVIRHLIQLAGYTERLTVESMQTPPEIYRSGLFFRSQDELDRLVHAIDDLRIRVINHLSDRRQAEEKLRDSQWKLNAIIDNHFQFTGLLDLEGRLLVVNRTALEFSGITEIEVLGRHLWDNPWSDQSRDIQQFLKRMVFEAREGKTIREIVNYHNARQQPRDIDFAIKPVLDDAGEIIYLLAEGRDISEQKRAEKELKNHQEHLEELVWERTREATRAKEVAEEAKAVAETANRAKSVFLANMSHELRTPLNAILGYAQLMLQDNQLTDHQKEQLTTINRSGIHLLALINDVLDMVKIETGHVDIVEADADLFELLHTLNNSLGLKASKKGLELVFSKVDDLPQFIRTDAGKLRQILFNLISNAIKFTSQGEVRVKVDYSKEDGARPTFRFEISDTGPGIEPEEMDKLFSAFEQTATGRELEEGSGLGLAISQNFARLLEGGITVESQAGKGSVFTLVIKAEICSSEGIPVKHNYSDVLRLVDNHPEVRILVVEDHGDSRKMLVNLLEMAGFTVESAVNGKDAIEKTYRSCPDLIFMDMRMPRMDGYEATRTIKQKWKNSSPPIVAVTASAFEDEKEKILASGCDDYVRKPILKEEIFETIRKLLKLQLVCDDSEPSISNPNRFKLLTPEILQTLPDEIIAELKTKSMELDQQLLKELVQTIRDQGFEEIADALKILVDGFQFDRIQELMGELVSR